jgi:mono/diheme cytochrome c family protein
MSRIGISLFRVMIPLGLTILLMPIVAAKKTPATSQSGHDLFMDRCGACHGDDAKGNGPAVGSLKTAPPDLTLLAQRNGGTFPAEHVKKVVGGLVNIGAHGSREMPIWGDLFHPKSAADQQVAGDRFKALVTYLESLQP